MSIRAAIFDLGGVVIDIDLTAIPRRLAELTGASAGTIEAILRQGDYDRLDSGRMDTAEFHRWFVERLGHPIPLADFEDGWNALYRGLIPGIDRLLPDLAGRLRLVALTNTNDSHARRWRPLYAPILSHFERLFLSCEIGVCKPDPAAFQHVLAYLQLPAADVAFIDDTPANVEAARQLGLAGIHAQTCDQMAEGLRRLAAPGTPIS
jgi:putative hydrolase of the HAD superfamily